MKSVLIKWPGCESKSDLTLFVQEWRVGQIE